MTLITFCLLFQTVMAFYQWSEKIKNRQDRDKWRDIANTKIDECDAMSSRINHMQHELRMAKNEREELRDQLDDLRNPDNHEDRE